MTLAKNGFEQICVECELYPTFIQVIFIRAYTHIRTHSHFTHSLVFSLWFMIYGSSSCIIIMDWTSKKALLYSVWYVNVTSMISKKMSLLCIYVNSRISIQFHSTHIINMKYDPLNWTHCEWYTYAFDTVPKVNLSSSIRATLFAFNRIIPPSTRQM